MIMNHGDRSLVYNFPESSKSPRRNPCLSGFQVGLPLGNVKARTEWKDIINDADLGGIAGVNHGIIEYCCMTGYVDNNDLGVGCITGQNNGTIRHCVVYGARYSTHAQQDIWTGVNKGNQEASVRYWGDSYYYPTDHWTNLNPSRLAGWLAETPEQYGVCRYALQYPFSVTFNTTGQGRIVASPARARYGDRVNLNVESGHVKEISCKLSNGSNEIVIAEIHGNEDEGYYTYLPQYSIEIKVVFDESVVNLTANDGGDGYYWRSYYGSTRELVADENTMVYQAAVRSGGVNLFEVSGRKIPPCQAVILRSSKPNITLTPTTTANIPLEVNELRGGNKSISEDKDAYVLSRGNDGKGQLGFYKLSGETIEADKAYLEITRLIPPSQSR